VPSPWQGVPHKVLQMLKRRAANEKASEMREHPDEIRYALMGCFLHVRAMEVTDEVTHMAIELIHRLDVRSEKLIPREWLDELERVDGKMQILSHVAEAVVERPDGIVRDVIFPRVKEETFRNLVAEFRVRGPQLRSCGRPSCSGSLRVTTGACCPRCWRPCNSAATTAFSRFWKP